MYKCIELTLCAKKNEDKLRQFIVTVRLRKEKQNNHNDNKGYKFSNVHILYWQVLAVYTFSKRVYLDDFENKPRKSVGYSTVSHFNVIHVDCHTAAVR